MPKPVYVVAVPSTKNPGKIKLLNPVCKELDSARTKRVLLHGQRSAIYKLTFGLKPEFIEGDDLKAVQSIA